MRANTWFDLITGTGSALTEEDLPRRCYLLQDAKPRYTGGLTGTAVTRVIEELDVEREDRDHIVLALFQSPVTRRSAGPPQLNVISGD